MSLAIHPIGARGDALVVVGRTLASSVTVLVDGRNALLIDGMGSVEDAVALAQLVERERGLTVRWLIATHYFSDHMAALARFPAATLLAHAACRETFAIEENRTDEEASFYVEPTELVRGERLLPFGRFLLRIFPNPGYTPDMLAVDIPALDAVHGGDTVVGDLVFLPYADPPALEGAITRLESLGRRHLLLSHGPVAAPTALANARHYLRQLTRGERVLARCLAPGAGYTGDDAAYHARNLSLPLDRLLARG